MFCNFQPGANLYSMLCGEIAISTRGGWRGGGGVGGAGRGGDDGFVAFELPHVFLVTSVIKYVLPGRQRGTE